MKDTQQSAKSATASNEKFQGLTDEEVEDAAEVEPEEIEADEIEAEAR